MSLHCRAECGEPSKASYPLEPKPDITQCEVSKCVSGLEALLCLPNSKDVPFPVDLHRGHLHQVRAPVKASSLL